LYAKMTTMAFSTTTNHNNNNLSGRSFSICFSL